MAHVIAADPDFLGLPVALLAPTPPETSPKVHSAESPSVVVLSVEQPITVEPRATLGGVGGHSTFEEYYNTIHVRPSEIRVGSVTATVVRQVEVWSAYFDDRHLDDVEVTGGEGIDVFGPVTPHTFGPLESVLYTLEVTTNGPGVIDARFNLVFTTSEGERGWRVIGRRIIEWTIPPNWQQPVSETLSYRTEVLTADDGTEQRIGLRQMPRRDLAFTPLVNGRSKRDYQRLLATWQHRSYAMADWPRGVGMQGLPAGGQIVQVLEPIPELDVGQLIVLRAPGDPARSQAVEVAEISGDGLAITLTSPVAEAYPVGSGAYPGLLVHAEPSLPSRRLTSDVATAQMAFRELWRGGLPELGAPEHTWRGREVLMRRPNWATSPEHEHDHPFEWIDSGRGAFDFRTPEDAAKDIRRFHYLIEGRDDVRWWEQWFARVRGRRGEFYAPTWERDLELAPDTALLVNGSFQLPIDDEVEIGRPANDPVYRSICVRLTDGTALFRQIISGEQGLSGPVLVLGESWPRNIDHSEIVAIHYMPRWRSATDEMTLRWVTNGVVQLTLAWQTLRDDQ